MQRAALASMVRKMPWALRKQIVRALYRRNGERLEDLIEFRGGSFYAYKIRGKYIPSEGLSWFLNHEHYVRLARTTATWAYQPRPGDIVIDIGAGIGEEAIVLGEQVGPSGKVICIEANPHAYEVLVRLIELNGLQSSVLAFNMSVSSTDGPITFNFGQHFLAGGLAASNAGLRGSCTVPAQRLDRLLAQQGLERISLLKCNIEGAERFVIQTLGEYAKKVEHYAISCHDFRFRNEGDPFFATKQLVTDFLREHGRNVISQSTGKDHIDDWVYA